ncbi:MAG: MaoC family dehydratase [Pseudomonadota bacterium]
MRYFEDFKVGDEAEFGGYEVTREEIVDFASKYDPQPFHLSDEGARGSIFKRLCASGWHTCAMTMRMMVDHMKESDTPSLGSPGIDEIRWRQPVYPGDILRVRGKVIGLKASESRPAIGFVKNSYEVINQRREVVMSFIGNGIFPRRPA